MIATQHSYGRHASPCLFLGGHGRGITILRRRSSSTTRALTTRESGGSANTITEHEQRREKNPTIVNATSPITVMRPLLVLAQQDGQGLDKRRETQGGLSTFAQQSSSALAVLRPYIIITLECKVNRVILHSLIHMKNGSPAAAIRGGPQRSTVACSGTQAQSRLARL